MQLIQRFKTCLLRRLFPNSALFPGRIFVSSLSIVYLFEVRKNKKAKDSKSKERVCLENSQEEATDKIIPPETDRSYGEL